MSSLARRDPDDWQSAAACQGKMGVAFYPPMTPEGKNAKIAREARAKAICTDCPVRLECLRHAIDIDERYGIWGGLNYDDRRRLIETSSAESASAS
ncbi:MAG: WhiB family transcriptional regulator [Ilumatobacter sp.]|jgi:WhiB family transcriptional regulator, redox-sensing transcriptional regulator|uniref:WhiB family transcriptional regulator n=1 Tax=Ilumatobacter sp. TaxID=1967498 RepID=UPI00391DCE84